MNGLGGVFSTFLMPCMNRSSVPGSSTNLSLFFGVFVMSNPTKPTHLPYQAAVKTSESPHYEAIGRLLLEYARTEALLHLVFNHVSGLGPDLGGALFGGARLPDIVAGTKASLKYRKRSQGSTTDIESCMAQLQVIANERAKLAHRFVRIPDGESHIETTNVFTSKSFAGISNDKFTIEDLRLMTEDCYRAGVRLAQYSNLSASRKRSALAPYFYEPWRYTPHAPKSRRKKNA